MVQESLCNLSYLMLLSVRFEKDFLFRPGYDHDTLASASSGIVQRGIFCFLECLPATKRCGIYLRK